MIFFALTVSISHCRIDVSRNLQPNQKESYKPPIKKELTLVITRDLREALYGKGLTKIEIGSAITKAARKVFEKKFVRVVTADRRLNYSQNMLTVKPVYEYIEYYHRAGSFPSAEAIHCAISVIFSSSGESPVFE